MGEPDFRWLAEKAVTAVENAESSATDSRAKLDGTQEEFERYRTWAAAEIADRDAKIEALLEQVHDLRVKVSDSIDEERVLRDELARLRTERDEEAVLHKTEAEARHRAESRLAKAENDYLGAQETHTRALAQAHARVRSLELELGEAQAAARPAPAPVGDDVHQLRVELEEQRSQHIFEIERMRVDLQNARDERDKAARHITGAEAEITRLQDTIRSLQRPKPPTDDGVRDDEIVKLRSKVKDAEREIQRMSKQYTHVTGLAQKDTDEELGNLRRERKTLIEQIEGLKVEKAAAHELRSVSAEKVARLERRVLDLEQELDDERERRRRDDAL